MDDLLTFQFSTCQPETWRARHIPLMDPSAWIRRVTHSPFSHVDILLEDGSCLGSSDSPDAPILPSYPEGNKRGVARRPADYQMFGVRRRATVRTEHKAEIIEYATSQLGKPFDHSALKPRVFLADRFDDRNWRTPDSWYCAELCTRACEIGGLWPWPILAVKNRVTAADFLLLINPLMLNVEAFWDPIPGLELMPGEIAVSRFATPAYFVDGWVGE